jgi:hypothetical protein
MAGAIQAIEGGLIPIGAPSSPMLAFEKAEDVPNPNAQSIDQPSAQGMFEGDQTVSRLAGHLRGMWGEAYQLKQPHQKAMIESARQRKGEYDPALEAQLKQEGASTAFLKITDLKCRAAEAWLKEITMNAGDRPWTMKPTPIPEMPQENKMRMIAGVEELTQAYQLQPGVAKKLLADSIERINREDIEEAKERAEKMEDRIADILEEGGFANAFNAFLVDFVTYRKAFIKGPTVKKVKTLKWVNGKPQVTQKAKMMFERVSPLDVYPLSEAGDIADVDMFVHHSLTRAQLKKFEGLPGTDDIALRRLLEQYGQSGLRNWLMTFDTAREKAEGRNTQFSGSYHKLDVLEFRGSIQGKLLQDWGRDVEDPTAEYACECWMAGSEVFRVRFNEDPLGRKPFFGASAVEKPGTFWGEGVPEMMADCQEVCNAAIRACVENMAIASGPQVAVDPMALPDGEKVGNIYAWRIWQVNMHEGGTKLPIEFFQPEMRSSELLNVFEKFKLYADEVTGIPAYTFGSDAGAGAAATASGLSMLMGAAAKGIKNMITNIGINLIEPMIEMAFYLEMVYGDRQDIKGDLSVSASGTMALIQKETLQLRRQEFLASTNNPVDLQIIGHQGRAELLRESAKTLEMDVDKLVPTREQLAANTMAAMGPAGQPDALAPNGQLAPVAPAAPSAALY